MKIGADYLFETTACLILFWGILCFLAVTIYAFFRGDLIAVVFIPPLIGLLFLAMNLWAKRPSLHS